MIKVNTPSGEVTHNANGSVTVTLTTAWSDDEPVQITFPKGSTARALLDRVSATLQEADGQLSDFAVVINGKDAEPEQTLNDGDHGTVAAKVSNG